MSNIFEESLEIKVERIANGYIYSDGTMETVNYKEYYSTIDEILVLIEKRLGRLV